MTAAEAGFASERTAQRLPPMEAKDKAMCSAHGSLPQGFPNTVAFYTAQLRATRIHHGVEQASVPVMTSSVPSTISNFITGDAVGLPKQLTWSRAAAR
jgi:hypothetical protein